MAKRTSLGILLITPDEITRDDDAYHKKKNTDVLRYFDEFDKQHNSTAKALKARLIESDEDYWLVEVIFDWKTIGAGEQAKDLVVEVEWTRKKDNPEYEIVSCEPKDSED